MDERRTSQDDQIEIEADDERYRALVAKDDEKRWPEMHFPLSLADALTRMTKNHLGDIRILLQIRNASSLNKQNLVELLTKQVPMHLGKTLQRLDEARYGVLKRIEEGGGQAYVPLEPHEYEYFSLRGLFFTGSIGGRRTLVMPNEVLDAFRLADGPSLRSTVRRNEEWLQVSQGLLFYYGFLSTGDLIRLVEDYAGAKMDSSEYLAVLYDALRYGYDMQAHLEGFTHDDVDNINRVMLEHHTRPDVPFHRLTKAQVLRAGKPDFVDRGPAYKAFVEFLRRSYQLDLAEAEDEAQLCVYEIQNGKPLGGIITAISEEFEVPTLEVLQGLARHLSELHNNTRQWILKGHTPRELLPADVAAMRPLPGRRGQARGEVIQMETKKKIGRNDPCPCGSGKKFKKCCGR